MSIFILNEVKNLLFLPDNNVSCYKKALLSLAFFILNYTIQTGLSHIFHYSSAQKASFPTIILCLKIPCPKNRLM